MLTDWCADALHSAAAARIFSLVAAASFTQSRRTEHVCAPYWCMSGPVELYASARRAPPTRGELDELLRLNPSG